MAQITISDELRQSYLDYTNDCMTRLDTHISEARSGDKDVETLRKEIFAIAHDIKGMGGSFDYDLMTQAGSLLCVYFRGTEDTQALDPELVDAHLQAMQTIINNQITGDGGDAGAELVQKLHEMVDQATSGI